MPVTMVTGMHHNEQPGDLEAGEGAHMTVMFTSTYTLNSRKVGDAVKKHWHVLSSEPVLPSEFKNSPLVAITVINWSMPTASHKRKSARLFHALFQMVAIHAEVAHSATM